MKMYRTTNRRGFSLVELLAVVLVLAVLAAVAIPLYTTQRKSAAGRTCKANLAAIASSMAAYALRNNAYPVATSAAMTAALVGSAEGLAAMPKCPIDNSAYGFSGGGAAITHVFCPNNDNAAANTHNTFGGTGTATAGGDAAGDWCKILAAPAADNLP